MSLIDDWGSDHELPVDMKNMADEDISQLSFLLGGVGDARHVYSTLVGLDRAHKKLDKKRQEAFRLHFTLLDIHPAALARDLCILILLEQLIDTPTESLITRAEILSTMFYTFAGVVMPGYCYTRLEKVMQDLRMSLKGDDPTLPSWIHVNSAATAKINSVIDFWLTIPQKFSTETTLDTHTPTSPADVLKLVKMPNISEEYRAGAEARIAATREDVIGTIKKMTNAQLHAITGLVPPGRNATAEEKKEFTTRLKSFAVKDALNDTGNMSCERYWYEEVKVFLPPPELWSRHVGMELFPLMSKSPGPSPDEYSTVSATSMDIILIYELFQIREHINDTWQPNSTLFDPGFGNANLKLDPFEAPGYIALFNQRFGINSTADNDRPDAPAFGNFVDLFEKVVEAMKSLKNQVKLEFLCGELTQELSKMRLGVDHTRPADFPRVYTRAHLSNVPYTLLKSADVPKYLGCEFVSQEAMHGLVILRKQDLPLPLTELASRPELVTWLTRVLLYTILPSSSHEGSFRVRLPNNLVAFVSLLIHLRGVGYPAHWLSEYLQAVLSGNLVTDIAPYTEKWPIPVSDTTRRVPVRSVRLDPWTVELETILATSLQGIPFSVPLPDDFASRHTDIGTFEATVESSSPWMGFMMGTMVNPMPVEDPVSCLLLYKPSSSFSADELVAMLPRILNGARSPAPGMLCVLTVQETVDVPIIRWRLSKTRVARMKAEGWVMVAYRTDVQLSFTAPVSASQWREV
ncbi:hypothetical protein C8R44DRAFT_881678 [Mycena epipterygia]|nr:hypothetical protein C8R44DRAFT_881678 [Mycena epipterygia]